MIAEFCVKGIKIINIIIIILDVMSSLFCQCKLRQKRQALMYNSIILIEEKPKEFKIISTSKFSIVWLPL